MGLLLFKRAAVFEQLVAFFAKLAFLLFQPVPHPIKLSKELAHK